MVKVLSIILVISMAFGAFTFTSTIDFVTDKLEYVVGALNSINGIGDIDFSFRVSGATYDTDSRALIVSNPNLNPNDDLTIREFLEMRLKQYTNNWGSNHTGVLDSNNMAVVDYIDSISTKVYRYHCVYKAADPNTISRFDEYSIDLPCIRFIYNNHVYYYIDPLYDGNNHLPITYEVPHAMVSYYTVFGYIYTPIVVNNGRSLVGVSLQDGNTRTQNLITDLQEAAGILTSFLYFVLDTVDGEFEVSGFNPSVYETEIDVVDFLNGEVNWNYNVQDLSWR